MRKISKNIFSILLSEIIFIYLLKNLWAENFPRNISRVFCIPAVDDRIWETFTDLMHFFLTAQDQRLEY